ncbi:unnamed protein product, partial [Protopolystoma xenopodis]
MFTEKEARRFEDGTKPIFGARPGIGGRKSICLRGLIRLMCESYHMTLKCQIKLTSSITFQEIHRKPLQDRKRFDSAQASSAGGSHLIRSRCIEYQQANVDPIDSSRTRH